MFRACALCWTPGGIEATAALFLRTGDIMRINHCGSRGGGVKLPHHILHMLHMCVAQQMRRMLRTLPIFVAQQMWRMLHVLLIFG
eukprot:4109738-Alexandrium_andersonii.AAC.1